ncbi:MAG: chorismate mutase [Treponema sp.]|nr:chorismate mutase [Treponema sp.]
MKKLAALRGAVRAENTEKDIAEQVVLLYDRLLLSNNLAEEDIVSVIFSVTGDIDALNPAAALRKSGRAGELALMVFQEGRFSGGLSRTIRVLVHCNLEGSPRHVYMNGAEVLRPDRA